MSLKSVLGRGLLLIYQMPKTGSQTVEATVQNCGISQTVFRFHFLSPRIARSIRRALRSGQANEQWKRDARQQLEIIARLRNLIRLRRFLALFRVRLPKLQIITGVREPIGLALASVFENHAFLFPTLEMATAEACRHELLRPKALTHIQDWFDLEIKAMTGIDVYQQAFPCKKGYVIYENAFARLLVYRSDFLAKLPLMLWEFLGCPVDEVVNRNLGAGKAYAAAYAEAKAGLRLPRQFVESQYSKKLTRHFFSDEERQKLLLQWCGREEECKPLSLVA